MDLWSLVVSSSIACFLIVTTIALCVCCGLHAQSIVHKDRRHDKMLASVNASTVTSLKWPSNFLFGVSTAAFQNEGFNPYSTWSMWANTSHVRDAPIQTCDSWYNFETVDIKNAQFMGCNAFRLSLDWARIEPKKGQFNAKALDRYVSMVSALKARGIEPVLTLVHFALPNWTCGWEDHETMRHDFQRFVQYVFPKLSPYVKYWVTINEPVIDAVNTHLLGTRWPGKKSFPSFIRAVRGMWVAHNAAFNVIKAGDPWSEISVAKNTTVQRVYNHFSPIDFVIDKLFDYVYNHAFIDACVSGEFNLFGFTASGTSNSLTYLGMNFYNMVRVGIVNGKPNVIMTSTDHPKINSMGWEMRPASIFTALKSMWERYHLPIMITEAGTPDNTERTKYLHQQLYCVANAIHVGIPVTGFMYWTLHDNYEWCESYMCRFGLFETDYERLRHCIANRQDPSACFKPRPAAYEYQNIITSILGKTVAVQTAEPIVKLIE